MAWRDRMGLLDFLSTGHESYKKNRVPVVGSGKGGMRELLEGGGQQICEDFSKLKEMVAYLLLHGEEREGLGRRGQEFARTFPIERFKKEWLAFIRNLL